MLHNIQLRRNASLLLKLHGARLLRSIRLRCHAPSSLAQHSAWVLCCSQFTALCCVRLQETPRRIAAGEISSMGHGPLSAVRGTRWLHGARIVISTHQLCIAQLLRICRFKRACSLRSARIWHSAPSSSSTRQLSGSRSSARLWRSARIMPSAR